jgi:hypothetical protein
MSSPVFPDQAPITAGPGIHDLLKSLGESRDVNFSANARKLAGRVIAMEVAEDYRKRPEGNNVEEWGLKIAGKDGNVYEAIYNSQNRSGTLMRPKTID